MKTVISAIKFEQKKDKGCKSKKIIKCQHCHVDVPEKELIMFAGYEICPYCMFQARE